MRFSHMITAVDVHACGEPGRVITAGLPPIPGDTMFAKMEHLRDHQDWLRKRDAARAARLSRRSAAT